MNEHSKPRLRREIPDGPWQDRVVYSRRAGGYARRKHELLVGTPEALDRTTALTASNDVQEIEIGDGEMVYLHRFEEDDELTVEDVVDRLAREGRRGEPNYVMFANPVYANPLYANPVYANPVYANPVDERASAPFANPLYANPV